MGIIRFIGLPLLLTCLALGQAWAQGSSLTTTFAGGAAARGAMVDVTAAVDLVIDSWDYRLFSGGGGGQTDDIRIYFVTGRTSYVGNESIPGAWTLLGATTVTTEAAPQPIAVDVGPWQMRAGETIGIYFTSAGTNIGQTPGPLGAFSTPELTFENRGVGKSYPFAGTFPNRVWNGTIHYRVGCLGDCAVPIPVVPTVAGIPGTRSSVDVVSVDTTSCGVDAHTPSCGAGGNDVVIELIAPFDGTATVDTCAFASFDTILAALDGPCGSPELACNNDTCGSGSAISFPVFAGSAYSIIVDGAAGATGTADVTVALDEMPTTYVPCPVVAPLRVARPLPVATLALRLDSAGAGGGGIAYNPCYDQYYGFAPQDPTGVYEVFDSLGRRLGASRSVGLPGVSLFHEPGAGGLDLVTAGARTGAGPGGLYELGLDARALYEPPNALVLSPLEGLDSDTSAPAYDPHRDIFYSRSGSALVRLVERADGSRNRTVVLDVGAAGSPPLIRESIGYTAVHGYELVVGTSDEALLFDREGAFRGGVPLGQTVAPGDYSGNFAGGLYWVWDGGSGAWFGFDLFSEEYVPGCGTITPRTLVLASGTHTMDTDTGMVDGFVSSAWDGTTFQFDSIDVQYNATVTVTGRRPLVLVTRRDTTITGTLILDGQPGDQAQGSGCSAPGGAGGTGGPGGFDGGEGGGPFPGLGGIDGRDGRGPGGGAGGEGDDAAGGSAGHLQPGQSGQAAGSGVAGAGGAAYAFSAPVGGSGGGGGSADDDSPAGIDADDDGGGGGGGGGGALLVQAGGRVRVHGLISARGGDGGDRQCSGGGGGGGSGGYVGLFGSQLPLVTGGIDVSGGDGTTIGADSEPGSPGRIEIGVRRCAPSCDVTAPPTPGKGDVDLALQVEVGTSGVVDVTVEFSTDAGASWSLCAAAGASPLPNPAAGVGAALHTFVWDTELDLVGVALGQAVVVRASVLDVVTVDASDCETRPFLVANLPECDLLAPAGTVSLGVSFDLDVTPYPGSAVDVTFEHSFDRGLSWTISTAAVSSPLPNPAPALAAGLHTFVWDSLVDGAGVAGLQPEVLIRALPTDGMTGRAGECQALPVDVLNAPGCSVVTPATPASADVTIELTWSPAPSTTLDAAFEYSTDTGATWLACTAAGSSPLPNPAAGLPAGPASFDWDSFADGVGLAGPQSVTVRSNVADPVAGTSDSCTSGAFDVTNVLACSLAGPTGLHSGAIAFTLDPSPTPAPLVDVTFEHSTDGGGTWAASTAAAGSPLPNPAPGTPAMIAVFLWDSGADMVGATGIQPAQMRGTVTDPIGGGMVVCQAAGIDVHNQPGCTMTGPAGMQSGEVQVDFYARPRPSATVDVGFEFSTDSGSTWTTCTAAGASPLPSPAPGYPGGTGSFVWHSGLDGVGVTGMVVGVFLRVVVTDPAVGTTSTCTDAAFDVANQPACTLAAAGGLSSGGIPLAIDATPLPSATVDSDFEFSTDGGATWTTCAASMSSPLANPASGVAGMDTFVWDSGADAVGVAGTEVGVLARATVTDPVVGSNAVCTTAAFDVLNQPSCTLSAPGGLSSGGIPLTLDPTPLPSATVDADFEFSTDGGATWTTCAASMSSPLANPASGVAGMDTFVWDSGADAVGATGTQVGVLARTTVTDPVIGSNAVCTTAAFDVVNEPGCTLAGPGSQSSGDITVSFDADPSPSATVDVTFEHSLDGGATWIPSTAAGASPLANPAAGVPAGISMFVWDSEADAVGTATVQVGVLCRALVIDPVFAGTAICTTGAFDVRNFPLCALSAPPGPTGGVIELQLTSQPAPGATLDATFEFSTDSGATWASCTAAPGSAIANPALALGPGDHAFRWESSVDGVGLVVVQLGVLCRATVTDPIVGRPGECQSAPVDVLSQPTCELTTPAGTQSGDITVTLTSSPAPSATLVVGFEYTSDGGSTWLPCTAAVGSPLANPAVGVPAGPDTFVWDSLADGVGVSALEVAVAIRSSVTDPALATSSTCSTGSFPVQNLPLCSLDAPVSPGSGELAVTLHSLPAPSATTDAAFEFSTDAGGTWTPCTPAGGSPLANPAVALPAGAMDLHWDSAADGVAGWIVGVLVRAIVTDPVTLSASACTTSAFDVENEPACTLAAPGGQSSGEIAVSLDATPRPSATTDAAFDYSLDSGATWNPCTAAGGSPLANPAAGVPAGVSQFVWDSGADGVALGGVQAGVLVRASVTDPVVASASACTTSAFDVLNVPACTLTAPGGQVSGEVAVSLDATPRPSATTDATFDYSLDSGATWNPCTAAGGSPLANPAAGVPAGVSQFVWDSVADGVGLGGITIGVIVRAAVSDPGAGSASECTTAPFDVFSEPACTLSGPTFLATADIILRFTAIPTPAATVTVAFEHSEDGGVTWGTCTAAAGSPLASPAAGVGAGATWFIWDSAADAVGAAALAPAVIVRATVTDSDSGVDRTCNTTPFAVTNRHCATCGDCDSSGVAGDATDSLVAAQISAGLLTATPAQEVCCDVDSSRVIDAVDALLMARFAAALPVVLVCP